MDEELIRRILNMKLEVWEVRNPEVNKKRYKEKEQAIQWTIQQLRLDPIRGGTLTDVPYEFFHTFGVSSEWAAIHDAVLIRDDNKCRICGKPAEEVHHIRPKHLQGKNHPRNLISLCKECHDEVHRRILDGIQRSLEDSLDFEPKVVTSLEGFM